MSKTWKVNGHWRKRQDGSFVWIGPYEIPQPNEEVDVPAPDEAPVIHCEWCVEGVRDGDVCPYCEGTGLLVPTDDEEARG